MQINPAAYTNLHFGFGILKPDYTVDATFGGDPLSAFEFQQFLRISGPARILSFGGWAFSTDPSTYMIFREGVTPANANTMAENMANFVLQNNLDGIDIDWEYPGVSANDSYAVIELILILFRLQTFEAFLLHLQMTVQTTWHFLPF